jgi:hypothetical protein
MEEKPQMTRIGFAAGALLLLLIPAAAAAEVRTGSVTDPTGDAPVPQRDVTAAEFTYDTQGSVVVKVTLAAAPDAATAATVGTRVGPSAEQCAGGSLSTLIEMPSGTVEQTFGGQPFQAPTVTVQGNVVTAQTSNPALANQPFACAFALAAEAGQGLVTDSTDPVTLQASAAPPPPPPPPPVTKASCRISSAKVRRGRSLVVRCTGVSGAISVRFTRRGKRVRKLTARVNGQGRARLTTRRLKRGRYRVTVLKNGRRLGARTVRIR